MGVDPALDRQKVGRGDDPVSCSGSLQLALDGKWSRGGSRRCGKGGRRGMEALGAEAP